MDKKQAYLEKLDAELDEWKAQITQLHAKADKAQADAKLTYLEEVDKLKAKQKEAEAQMEKLKTAQGDAWKDVTKGVEAAWDDLGKAMKSAWNRFA